MPFMRGHSSAIRPRTQTAQICTYCTQRSRPLRRRWPKLQCRGTRLPGFDVSRRITDHLKRSARGKGEPASRGNVQKHVLRGELMTGLRNWKLSLSATRDTRCGCAPCKGGAFQWVRIPPGEMLQPEATGAGSVPEALNLMRHGRVDFRRKAPLSPWQSAESF
jgi:hypothetical protein